MLQQFYPIIFGAIQGFLEWLPVSSQGQLVLLMVGLLNLNPQDAINMSIFLHTGTLLSVIIYFRRDIRELFYDIRSYRLGFTDERNSVITLLIIATLLTGVVGYPIYKSLTIAAFSGEVFLAIIGLALISIGILQKVSIGSRSLYRKLNLKDSVLLGLLQALSVIPGISRSGITVSGFLMRKYNARNALRYSFLMSIPAVAAAEIGLALMNSLPPIPIEHAALGLFSAFFAGLVSIHILLKAAERVKFWKFCIIIGIIALIPLLGYLF